MVLSSTRPTIARTFALCAQGADPNPGVTDDALVRASGKLRMLDRLLARLLARGHRAVVFSQFMGTLDVIDDVLRMRGVKFCRLDGGTNRVQRTVDINAFNAPGSKIGVFLMSTRAGGLGINLQTADTCILYDSDWNPQADLQGTSRSPATLVGSICSSRSSLFASGGLSTPWSSLVSHPPTWSQFAASPRRLVTAPRLTPPPPPLDRAAQRWRASTVSARPSPCTSTGS